MGKSLKNILKKQFEKNVGKKFEKLWKTFTKKNENLKKKHLKNILNFFLEKQFEKNIEKFLKKIKKIWKKIEKLWKKFTKKN